MKFQVMEKEAFGTDWALVRYNDQSTKTFETKEDATKAAVSYLNQVNVENALTADEKMSNVEAFMETEEGCLLGILDGKDWYMTNPKGDRLKKGCYELSEKTEVAVRQVPGS